MEANEKENYITIPISSSHIEGFKIYNCMDCSEHLVQPDPDADDWFCDDDEKVICLKENKDITVACRPYNKRKECKIPDWCPLLNN